MTATSWLGIDPGTLCGWAVVGPDGARIHSGTWNLQRRRGDGSGMIFVRFERLFRELLAEVPGAPVVFEQQQNRFAGSAEVGAGIMAHIQRICEETQRPYTGIAFSVVKKHATGRGNANKTEMIAAAQERWPGLPETATDNEADALWIADAGRAGLA